MRIRKPVKIDDREFVVRELTIREINDLFHEAKTNAANIEVDKESVEKSDTAALDFFKGELKRFVDMSLEGTHDLEIFYEMAPSELNVLYEAFKEVNAVFFLIARSTGMIKLLDGLKESMLKDFSSLVVGSSNLDTLRRSITVTPTSLPQ